MKKCPKCMTIVKYIINWILCRVVLKTVFINQWIYHSQNQKYPSHNIKLPNTILD